MTSARPTKAQANEAARSFLRHRESLGEWTRADMLMGLGRLYEFPAATPPFPSTLTVANISAFILAHAAEIE